MSTKKSKSFIERFKAFAKMDDAGKVERFLKRYIKFLNKQISLREDKISESKEALEDLLIKQEEVALSVDLDAIKNSTDLPGYIDSYMNSQVDVINEIETIENDIKNNESQVEKFKKLIALVA